MTLSKDKFKGYMVYLAPADIKRLQKFAKLSKVSSSQVMRDAIDARLAKENPYIKGFNAGLSKAVDTIANMQASQMRFPSGKSYAELVEEELAPCKLTEPS
jgi:hypothetical protein